MTLHENSKLFNQAIRASAQRLDIRAVYVEKDYWVTVALKLIFENEVGKDVIFKGGTSLSKCYRLIERFSEDIDLVVLRQDGDSGNKLKEKLKAISKSIEEVLPEEKLKNVTKKMGMNRKTAHGYKKTIDEDYGQVRDKVILESSWLGYHEPYTTATVNSFIGEMMIATQQQAIAEEYGLAPFELGVLEPIRTICEKIMSLVRFSYGENAIENLKNKVRHTYDLHQLLLREEFSTYFDSSYFEKMLLKVASDDVASYKNDNQWLNIHPKEAVLFKDLDNSWNSIKSTYNGTFRDLVYGELPHEKDVKETLKRIKERLRTIEWNITTE